MLVRVVVRIITRLSLCVAALRRRGLALLEDGGASGLEMSLLLVAPICVAATVAAGLTRAGSVVSNSLASATFDAVGRAGSGIQSDDLVLARTDGARITHLLVDVSLSAGSPPVSLDPNASAGKTTVSYIDSETVGRDLPYSVRWITGNGDAVLDKSEVAEIDVDISSIRPQQEFTIEIRPARGAYVSVQVETPYGPPLPPVLRLH